MKFAHLSSSGTLPLIITPEDNSSADHLMEWIALNKSTIDARLAESGAILFRGFGIRSPQDFEAVAKAVDPDLKNDYLGTSPRDKKTDFVFSASELPPHYPIMQHCEMSFLPSAPRRLFFYCHVQPEYGGETPICDFRKVYRELDETIRDEFERRGIRHIRNYSAPEDKSRNAFQLKKWDEMFLTSDKSVIEKKCADNSIQCEWKKDNGLRLINSNEASKIHPLTKEKVWYNHAQVFHIDAAAEEYRHIHNRQRRWETFKTNWLLQALTAYKKWTKDPAGQSMHVTFGDGKEIPGSHIRHLIETIWKNMVVYPWRQGDVLCIDNFSTSHGRLPYTGAREIMVCWTS
jgi:alpha-ketoglutarate-dependent taurine dioxygenase